MLAYAAEVVSEGVARDGRGLGGAGYVGGSGPQRVGPRAGRTPAELPPLPGRRHAGVARDRRVPPSPAIGADLGAGDGSAARPGPPGEQVLLVRGQPRVPFEFEGAPDRLGG